MPARRLPSQHKAEPRRNRAGKTLSRGPEELEERIAGIGLDWSTIPLDIAEDNRALEVWKHLEITFGDMPTRFRESDREVLVAFCRAVALASRAQSELSGTGLLVKGRGETRVKNPAVAIWNQAQGHVRLLGRELGLTPSGRNMLGLADQPTKEDPIYGPSPFA